MYTIFLPCDVTPTAHASVSSYAISSYKFRLPEEEEEKEFGRPNFYSTNVIGHVKYDHIPVKLRGNLSPAFTFHDQKKHFHFLW